MNPESRIKLIRMLEEIKQYQEVNTYYRKNNYFAIGFYLIYPIILFFIMDKPVRELYFFLIMLIPVSAIYLWLRFRNKLEERYKLLANTVLELGSIAQEAAGKEMLVTQKVTSSKKKIIKRKK